MSKQGHWEFKQEPWSADLTIGDGWEPFAMTIMGGYMVWLRRFVPDKPGRKAVESDPEE